MTKAENLLNQIMEECAEVIVRCSKAKRFGLYEIQPGQTLTNRERILEELTDLDAARQMLEAAKLIRSMPLKEKRQRIITKIVKVNTFMQYSRKLGTLTD